MDSALAAHAGAARDRHPQVLQRPRELHARQPVHPRRGARRCAGFFVGAGFNSVGIASAGGAGRALAEWVVEGEPTVDLTGRRHPPVRAVPRATTAWLRDRVTEVLGLHYAVPWPNRELRHGAAASAARRSTTVLGRRPTPASAARWAGSAPTSSRPPACRPGDRVRLGQAELAAWVAAEQRAPARPSRSSTRPRSPSTSCTAPDAEAALQWICTDDVAVPVGRDRLHRDAQRARGLRVRRDRDPRRSTTSTSSSRSAATTERDQDWLRRHVPAGLDAHGRRT